MRSLAAPGLLTGLFQHACSSVSALPSMWCFQLPQDPIFLLDRIYPLFQERVSLLVRIKAHNSKGVPFLQLAALPWLGYSARAGCLTVLCGMCFSLWEAYTLHQHGWFSTLCWGVLVPLLLSPCSDVVFSPLVWFALCSPLAFISFWGTCFGFSLSCWILVGIPALLSNPPDLIWSVSAFLLPHPLLYCSQPQKSTRLSAQRSFSLSPLCTLGHPFVPSSVAPEHKDAPKSRG